MMQDPLFQLAVGLTFLAAAMAADWPEADKLPSQPDLPNPLVMFDGTPVTTPDDWYEKRRPELKELFSHYMYGRTPPPPERVTATNLYENTRLFDGKATLRELELTFGPAGTPPIHLLIIVPNRRDGPVSVFVGLNFCGNHSVVGDPGIAIPRHWMYERCAGCVNNLATAAGRGSEADVWCVEQCIDRGYAVATFYNGDIDPDRPDFTDGVHPHYFRKGQTEPAEHDWGTIAAWAWGLHRAVDYCVTDPAIDSKRICAIGHSRLGKTALLAAAFDERIALAVPHQSGTGGTALSRDNDQETVARINHSFPHWFADAFTHFDNRESHLPIDQHLLVALVAPRPLLDTQGTQDEWANFNSAWRGLQSADQVYKFLGGPGIVTSAPVEGDETFTNENCGTLAQYRRDSPHVLNAEYWTRILDFADRQWERRGEDK